LQYFDQQDLGRAATLSVGESVIELQDIAAHHWWKKTFNPGL
jgi:hypothetical protein